MSASTTTEIPALEMTAEAGSGPAPRAAAVAVEPDQRVEWRDVGWRGYLDLLRLRGEHNTPRLVYLDGTVWLVSLSFAHERFKERLGWMIMVLIEEFGMACVPAGSTTFRREGRKGGVEGDQTYYIANEQRIRGKSTIDLKVDPPPDLAIEAVHTHEADAAVEVYRRFEVPEVWVCGASKTVFLVLQPTGDYAESPTSAAFPFLKAAEVHEWINRPQTVSETEWLRAFRAWAREVLLPRARETETGTVQGAAAPQQPGKLERSN